MNTTPELRVHASGLTLEMTSKTGGIQLESSFVTKSQGQRRTHPCSGSLPIQEQVKHIWRHML